MIRAVDGPLASVRGEAPEDLAYDGAAEHLRTTWIAVRASLRSVVDEVTLADVAADRLPARTAPHRAAGRLVTPLGRPGLLRARSEALPEGLRREHP